MPTLLIRLEGPMQSWANPRGAALSRETVTDPSQFGAVASQLLPTKSAVLGLCAAALGIDRHESVEHLRRLTFGVRVDRAGVLQTEFQTRPHDNPNYDRHISTRTFLGDASFLVGLEGDGTLLGQLYRALQNPHWPLSLGRKSYLPSVPLSQPGPPVPFGLAEALSRHPLPERLDEQAVYVVERRAQPEDAPAPVGYEGWDEPAGPFVLRRYQGVEAVRYEGTWGQVFGYAAPAPTPSAPAAAPRPQPQRRVDRVAVRRTQDSTKSQWTEAEARSEGLPLYYAQEWFERELSRLGTLAAMEREHGYSNQALSVWAGRHGLQLRPRVAETAWAQVEALLREGQTLAAIARTLELSKTSVQRYAKRLQGEGSPDLT